MLLHSVEVQLFPFSFMILHSSFFPHYQRRASWPRRRTCILETAGSDLSRNIVCLYLVPISFPKSQQANAGKAGVHKFLEVRRLGE